MADLKKIDTIDGLKEKQFNAEPGRHAGLQILMTGTNAAGITGGFADIGRFVINRNGQPRVNRSVDVFAAMANIRKGTNVLNSTTGAAFSAVTFIPFSSKVFPNAINITGDKELNIRFIPKDNGTFSDLEITVQSQLSSIEEHYDYLILGEDVSEASAVSSKPIKFNTPNVTELFLKDVDSVISELQFESNGRVVISNNSFLALQGYTNYNNEIEDPTFDIVEIENITPGIPGSSVNKNNILRLSTTGAGDVDITVCSAINWKNLNR